MINDSLNYLHSELTQQIIGACIKIHKQLGPGYMEVIYQRALSQQLSDKTIDHAREQWITIYYNGKSVGKKRVDFLIGSVIVEIKAKTAFTDQDFIQTLSYLKASHHQLALLINFGSERVQIKRLINEYTRSMNKYGQTKKT